MKLGIIGGGAWGSALAQAFSSRFDEVLIYAIEEDVVDSINSTRENKRYLAGIKLSGNIIGVNASEIKECEVVFVVTPTQYIRETLQAMEFRDDAKIIICAKGLEIKSKKLISKVVEEVVGTKNKIGVLTGPTFASEVAKGLPTALVIAMKDINYARELAEKLNHNSMRVYYSDDVIGVQIGGAVKNVIAISTGLVSGAKLGHNAMAGLITRGINEILEISRYFGGKDESTFGLSGLGDLVLTGTSDNSRNFSLGVEIGKLGRYDDSIRAGLSGVSEGYYTSFAINDIIKQNNLSMPICKEVYEICHGARIVEDSIRSLMAREIKKEYAY